MATERNIESIENARQQLDEFQSEIMSRAESSTTPLNNEKEVVIAWLLPTVEDYSNLENFLQEYTWSTNMKPQPVSYTHLRAHET